MNGANLNKPEEVDALVDLWMGTPEGKALWPIMWTWAKTNDNWVRGDIWFGKMKKHYVRIMQWHLNMTISEEENEPNNCNPT